MLPNSDIQKKERLQSRIAALNIDIAEICNRSGTAGLSLGVLHQGIPIAYSSFGYRDVEKQLRTDENTVYHLASVGKFITSYALGLLVQEGKLKWEDPIKLHMREEFTHWNKFVESHITVLDCVTHQTGLASQNNLWLAERGHMNFGPDETFTCVSDLEPLDPPGTTWKYNNWGYAIAGKLTEKLTGQTWGDFLQERIFIPLNLSSTTTGSRKVMENTALGYMALASGGLILNGRPEAGDNTVQTGAFGIQSSVYDLLKLYKALFSELKAGGGGLGPDVEMLTKRHVDLKIRRTEKGGEAEQSYSMGWVRTELPGVPSMNPRDTRIIGAVEDSTMLWHHNGNYPGFTSAAYLLPSTQTAVVVLTNSTSKLEVPDIIAQMVIETILKSVEKGAPPIDWVSEATKAAKQYDILWSTLPFQFLLAKPHWARPLILYDYCGKYYNRAKNWYMQIWYAPEKDGEPEALWMCMQGNKKEAMQRYKLKHYYQDVFSWLLTCNEVAYRGWLPILDKDFYLLKFEVDEDLIVQGLVWNIGDGDYLYPKEREIRY